MQRLHLDKKVSYRKQIARQHSRYQKFWSWQGAGSCQKIPHIKFDHHAKFGWCCVRACRRSKIVDTLGPRPTETGSDWSRRNTPLTRACQLSKCGRSWPNGRSVVRDPPEKWPVAFCLSTSLKVIGTDTDRSATYDFVLVIHRNHGPISCLGINAEIFPPTWI